MALVHSCDVTTLDQLHPKNGPTNGLLPITMYISKQLNLLVDYGNWLFNFFVYFMAQYLILVLCMLKSCVPTLCYLVLCLVQSINFHSNIVLFLITFN